jgi:2',3'-cyclic-nucleotide 2'-phosphodiesterase/3'-nucleotidase
VLFNTDRDQRHFLTEEIRKMGTLDPKPNNNWKFVPEAWAKPALERDRKLLFGNQ